MSDSRRITVRIHNSWVKSKRASGAKLCCAFGFKADDSNDEYNVISWAEDPTPVNTIVWSEKYHMAVCKHGIELGLSLGDRMIIDKNWAVAPVQASQKKSTDKSEPGFMFENPMPAAALVFKRIRNRVSPAYVLSAGSSLMQAGKYKIRPTGNIAIFFAAQQSGTTFSIGSISTAICTISYMDQPKVTVSFTEDGDWISSSTESEAGVDGSYSEDWTKSSDAKL